MARGEILVVNSGSSSIRLAVFDAAGERRVWSAHLEGVGGPASEFTVEDEAGRFVERVDAGDYSAALAVGFEAVARRSAGASWAGIGHRLVHGGEALQAPQLIDAEVEARLAGLTRLAPLHMPHNIAGIEAARRRWPDAPQVACFDTAFHATLPERARAIAMPRALLGDDVRRYGFHGLSFESIVQALKADGVDVARERLVVAHLGAGSSMCAIVGERSIETTMGFSTLAGLPMGTRCGDVDPGALLHALIEGGIGAEGLARALYEQSGLLALSGLSGDVRDLLQHRSDPRVDAAIDFFCYQARRQIAALAGAMGGLDRLVFTGGIGANACAIRAEICAGLEFLGVAVDARRNEDGKVRLSRKRSRVVVEARATDEEGVIARHVRDMLDARGA